MKHNRKEMKLKQDFLAEAVELVEKPSSPWGHVGIWSICLVVISMLIWGVVGKIDVTITARGKILAGGDKGVQIVQTENGGRVDKIHVKDGDRVEKGDVLVTLSAGDEKELLNYRTNVQGENAYEEKLIRKLLTGKEIDKRDEQNGKEYKVVYEYLVSIQKEHKEKMTGLRIELKNAKENLSGSKKMLSYARQEEKDYKELYEEGAVAKKEWEDKKYSAEQQEQSVKGMSNELRMLESSIKTLKNEYETQLTALLVENQQESQRNTVELKQSNNDYEKQFLRASVSGIVKSVLINTEGGVLAATQNVVEIIPDEEDVV